MRKKISLTIISVLFFLASQAQEKGFHITVSGNLGASTLGYKTNTDVKSSMNLGYGGNIGVQYFFNNNWGLSTGVGLSFYKSDAKYVNDYNYEEMLDDAPFTPNTTYILQIGLNNWTEIQKAYFLEIPLMAVYQTKWGQKGTIGMYFGIGAKMQIPIISQKYEVKDGSELRVAGYFPDHDMLIDDLPDYGFGTNDKINYKGDMKLKLGVSGTVELGLLISLTRRLDLSLGTYADYGFISMKGKNKIEGGYLIGPEEGSNTIHPSSYVGDNLHYGGYVNSTTVDKVNPFSVGGKAGLRIKIGELKDLESIRQNEREWENATVVLEKRDTANLENIEESLKKIIDLMGKTTAERDSLILEREIINARDEDGLTSSEREILKERIFFDLRSAVLHPGSKMQLDRKIKLMNEYPEMRLRILGNTCDRGNEEINIPLGLERAKAVKEYMESRGIESSRLVTATQSSYDPLVPNVDEESRSVNRRCDFEVDRK